MKIFERGDKINFVDENDVFVGYDLSQSCCEQAGWFLSRNDNECRDIQGLNTEDLELDDFRIDGGYFKQVDMPDNGDGGMVQFRMIDSSGDIVYIYFYNIHNGHGFTAEIGGIQWEDGVI